MDKDIYILATMIIYAYLLDLQFAQALEFTHPVSTALVLNIINLELTKFGYRNSFM